MTGPTASATRALPDIGAEGPIVFLHIPKTAGQTIHNELARVVGEDRVSPIRVHNQHGPKTDQMPAGFRLYSGHLNWTGIEALPEPRFTFTVLRDPYERIASFYFYLLDQAEQMSEEALDAPSGQGMKKVLRLSADEYFFGGDRLWQVFVRDHYDNFYTSYFATRKMRGWADLEGMTPYEKMTRALAGARGIDRIYAVADLATLEADIAALTGQEISVVGRYVNAGPQARDQRRWPALLERFERDESARRLSRFGALDEQLMENLGLAAEARHGDEGDD